MAVTKAEVLKIAELARLDFDEAELETFVLQFQRILDFIAKLKEVDVQDVPPTSHVSLAENFERYGFRGDNVGTSLSAEEVLAGAPDPGDGHFRVPKVLP